MAETSSPITKSANGGILDDSAVVSNSQAVATNQHGPPEEVPVAPQADQGRNYWDIAKGLITRALVIYFITSLFRKPAAGPDAGNSTDPVIARLPSSNLYPTGMLMDMYVYICESTEFNNFDNQNALLWHKEKLMYGDWTGGQSNDGIYEETFEFPISKRVQNNGTLYMHTFFVKSGKSPDPSSPNYSPMYAIHRTKQLNRFKKLRYKKTHNLLTGETSATPEQVLKAETMKEEIVSHWHPNITINMVYDHTAWTQGSIPAPLDEYVVFDESNSKYYPIVYINDYWNLLRDYQPLNETVKSVRLSVTYQPLTLFKWQMYTAQTMKNKWTSSILGENLVGEENDDEQDSIKEAFLETNHYLLGLTVVITLFHTVFEFMAFKNDIQFWNNRKSLEGLSVRSVFFNVFQSIVVLLYVMDNETNTVVRISVFIGLAIEIWKIHKVVDVRVDWEDRIFGIPKLRFDDKSSYVESSTRQYDNMAFRYLSWALFPLLIGYAVYSVIYNEHKGWYSFVLSLLYGFLLTFGFIMMTPQLFINYKLKSVAHLPWRMMTYKALNTFIDDIFAFVIKMPTMYRLGCLRDDVVFFIFLYQRWIYRVDPSRVNEFGTSAEMEQHGAPAALEAKSSSASELVANGNVSATESRSDASTPPGSPDATSNRKRKNKHKADKKRD